MTKEIIIHADGACAGNPGPGGWAAVISGDAIIAGTMLTGGDPHTTNNIMEMTAVRAAMDWVLNSGGFDGARIVLRLDSEYVLKGLSEWLPGWKRKGWVNSSGKPVKNRALWEELDRLKDALEDRAEFSFVWVRGHSGDIENDRVDAAAVEARDRARKETAPWRDPAQVIGADAIEEEAGIDKGLAEIGVAANEHGFTRYSCPSRAGDVGYLFTMQKKVKDGDDLLFHAHVEFWDMGQVTRGALQGIQGQVKAQFYTQDDRQGHAVNVSLPFTGFDVAEEFLGGMWEKMGFGRYERAPAPTP